MLKRSSLKQSRLFCPITRSFDDLSFSLVDYKNNYFTSNDLIKIIEFYDGFEKREHLIQWMEERPTGVTNIFEVKGSNEIIVVIPTADFNGKYAKECRENIFKGLRLIFAESGGREDFYFNYSHNCNMGIKKAMEYNPKWIVVSNDDMQKVDNISTLVTELNEASNNDVAVCFSQGKRKKSSTHSYPMKIGKKTILYDITYFIFSKITRTRIQFEKKHKQFFGKNILSVGLNFPYSLFSKGNLKFINGGAFFILNSKIFNENYFFDEVFINGVEDVDLSLRIKLGDLKTEILKYRIKSYRGSTLGRYGSIRSLRDIINEIYFNYKYDFDVLSSFYLDKSNNASKLL